MSQPKLFINSFQKGSSENPNIGMGTLLGIETYNKKGVAQLTKDTTESTKTGGFTWTGLPKYIATNGDGDYYTIVQNGANVEFYYSGNEGKTWTDCSGLTNKVINSLIYFQGYFLAFLDASPGGGSGSIYYFPPNGTSPVPLLFKNGLPSLTEFPTIVSPFDGFLYFGSANYIGQITPGTAGFNPGGSSGTDYVYSPQRLTLPNKYIVTCLSFFPVDYLSIGTSSFVDSQVADIILWNPTLSTYETPLRLYSKSSASGTISYPSANAGLIQSGIVQLINRNNLLYAVTGGDFCLYETNGSNFSLLSNIGLHSSIRKTTGNESTLPVFVEGFSSAIAVIGNKILTGISTPDAPNYPANYGLFPCGIWTTAFSDGGGIGEISYGINGSSVQCEFTISTGSVVATGGVFQIGCILPTRANSALISWADNSSGATVYGIDYIETNNFQNNIANVIIESEMMEVGSPISPATIGNIQLNLVRNLMTGQTISVYYRTGFDQDFQLLTGFGFNGTFTGDGTTNGYPITQHQIGATKYVQFQIHIATVPSATDATIATYTPQLRNFVVGDTNN